ncbi:MAG: hypothetical protein JWQ66_2322 [Mucilaginibacter sp.]|nr:hypothetical protein [Mucilaginibacter sp.]
MEIEMLFYIVFDLVCQIIVNSEIQHLPIKRSLPRVRKYARAATICYFLIIKCIRAGSLSNRSISD